MAATVRMVARGLDTVSGHDWRDPQWVRAMPEATRCVDALERGVAGLRVGLVEQAQAEDLCEPAVTAGLARACKALEAAGATVVAASVPLWRDAWKVQVTLLVHLAWAAVQSEGQGSGHLGAVDVDAMRAFAMTRRLEADQLPPMFKMWLLAGRWLHERHLSTPYGVAQNLRLAIRAEVDAAVAGCDLLLTPSTFRVAPTLSDERLSDADFLATRTSIPVARLPEAGAAGSTANPGFSNSSPLNLSSHPALVLPSGADDAGLPVSVQLVGRRFDEGTVFAAAAVLEQTLRLDLPAGGVP
jgi:amidase